MIVTTSGKPTEAQIAKAAALAGELGGRFVRRGNETLAGIRRKQADDKLLVAGPEGIRFYDGDEPALYFHPSMAFVRVKRLRGGERDPMIEISGCEPGDSVLDCTAGLASDAIVFSYAVGGGGAVTASRTDCRRTIPVCRTSTKRSGASSSCGLTILMRLLACRSAAPTSSISIRCSDARCTTPALWSRFEPQPMPSR